MEREGTLVDGKYRIGRLIGSGGMGRVFEATHTATERPVAIKILTPDCSTHPDMQARFDREARAAGLIGHDNICEVTDVGRLDDGSPYLVMPLLRGETLSAAIARGGPLPMARCVDIAAQTLAALAAAHAAGIVHRDLKPDNVFLVRMGDREDFVKVLDFGISKFVGPRADAAVTHTGTVVGTAHYMSPEQARGVKDLDARVDVYATGVIVYQMLTARTPYDGDTYNELLAAVLLDPFPAVSVLRKDVPGPIEAVVTRATARDRGDRYPDAAAMRRALVEAAGGVSKAPAQTIEVAATIAGMPAPVSPAPPARDRQEPVSGVAATAAVTTAQVAVAPTTTTPPRRRLPLFVALGAAAIALAAVLAVFLRPGRGSDGTPERPGVPAVPPAGSGGPATAPPPRPVPAPPPVAAPEVPPPSAPRAAPPAPPAMPAAVPDASDAGAAAFPVQTASSDAGAAGPTGDGGQAAPASPPSGRDGGRSGHGSGSRGRDARDPETGTSLPGFGEGP